MLTTEQKGIVAETAIVHAAARLGIGVLKPVAPERYDLVLDLGSSFVRVQCKWVARRGDVLPVRCYSSRRGREGFLKRSYTADEVDAIVAYCAELDRCYFLPLDLFGGRTQVQLRLSPTHNNQETGINWADRFEFTATLARHSEGP